MAILEDAICDVDGCLEESELYMEADCHIGGGLAIMYTKSDGILHVTCNICGDLLDEFQIARE